VSLSFDILKSLDVFLNVADAGSMTTASRRLGVTQSAISQQIKLLEAELGSELFDRQSRPLVLTASGIALYQRAGRLVLDAKETWAVVRQASETLLPHLRLAVFSTLANALVPAVTAAASTGELSVQAISILRGVSRSHTEDLINRHIDVAVTSDALYQHESIERHELFGERYILLLPPGTSARSTDLRVIAHKLPFIRYTSRIQSGQLIERHFRRLQLDINSTLAFESPQDLITAVASGYGWSVVTPSQLAYSLWPDRMVETLPFPAPGLSRNITLIARKGEFPNVVMQLCYLMRRVLREELLPLVALLLPNMPDAISLVEDDLPNLNTAEQPPQ
jgi:DNA-binding transcriptional LysR family regulator